MIGYLIAWPVYLLAALMLFRIYRGQFMRFLPRGWQPVSLGLLAVVLFTPWPIDGDTWFPAPAIIAVMFNLMEKDGLGLLKSLLPLLFLSTVVCSVAWWKARRAES